MSLPDNSKPLDGLGSWVPTWLKWFSDADRLLTALRLSGPTANRPTDFLFIGRRYYDTTLGKPVYLHDVAPNVWHAADGSVA